MLRPVASIAWGALPTHPTPFYSLVCSTMERSHHDDILKWQHFSRYWPFVQGIHQSLVNSPHKGPWHRALMFSMICAWINGWVNIGEAGDLRHHCTHYDVTVVLCFVLCPICWCSYYSSNVLLLTHLCDWKYHHNKMNHRCIHIEWDVLCWYGTITVHVLPV